MERIKLTGRSKKAMEDLYSEFIISQSAKGVSDATLRNYKYVLRDISRFYDISLPIELLTKSRIEYMIVDMRESGLAHNSIATYLRVFKTFLNWCKKNDIIDIEIPSIKEKETVKETYSDEELEVLLRRPAPNCQFGEFRNWVIINFLMNSGCRAATVRNIQIRDVELSERQVTFRHTKNGKIQVIPLCSHMITILREYMNIRGGKDSDYLFCDEYGGMLSQNALRIGIKRYNRKRGIQKTSIHMFRHTFARKYLVDCGGDAFTLQKLLGHSTLAMTKRYCSIFDADISKNFDRVSPLAQLCKPKEKIKNQR